ncbi:MAG TPA: tRNA-uridine aminocarboxypropyltransferase [Myxococcota bacterium]|nr:tRNA-uridine aminocarboxypropyltransferase [Myxococcota bacterium]HRY92750.1 tRNA-uridine aminocarboxypropyltransferase [Myxococcota bacterium]HSA21458.1 tRNA-uridine aminocarboxypropyltransferase [Myxococcota bacterium]
MGPPRGTPPGPGFVPREQCWRCRKAREKCVCATVPRVENRTALIVLQHKTERRHPLGSVRLLRLGLARARVEIAFQESVPPLALPAGAALLYPAPGARDLASLGPDERPAALVVLDGTWSQAKRMFRESPWLQALPRFLVTPRAPGRYRIRTEPSPRHVSTLEAVVLALLQLEPDTPGLLGLVTAFDQMIEAQVQHMPAELRPPPSPPPERLRGP